MLRFAAVLAAACILAPLPAMAQTAPAQTAPVSVTADLERCIAANAAAVERAVPSLQEATVFLADQLCAREVATAYQAASIAEQERYLTALREECEASRAQGVPPSPWAYEMSMNPCEMVAMQEQSAALYPTNTVMLASAGPAPAEATALAARLLLEARLARAE